MGTIEVLPPVEMSLQIVIVPVRVGGLTRNSIFGKFGIKSNIDANDLTETGSYYLTTGITNARTWTFFEVIKINDYNVIQKELTANGLNYRIRTYFEGEWKEWKEITFK